jgi:hypothetical protein
MYLLQHLIGDAAGILLLLLPAGFCSCYVSLQAGCFCCYIAQSGCQLTLVAVAAAEPLLGC